MLKFLKKQSSNLLKIENPAEQKQEVLNSLKIGKHEKHEEMSKLNANIRLDLNR